MIASFRSAPHRGGRVFIVGVFVGQPGQSHSISITGAPLPLARRRHIGGLPLLADRGRSLKRLRGPESKLKVLESGRSVRPRSFDYLVGVYQKRLPNGEIE